MAIFLSQFASLDGDLAQRIHYLVTGRGHVLHDQQTTRPSVAGPREMRGETTSEATAEVPCAHE